MQHAKSSLSSIKVCFVIRLSEVKRHKINCFLQFVWQLNDLISYIAVKWRHELSMSTITITPRVYRLRAVSFFSQFFSCERSAATGERRSGEPHRLRWNHLWSFRFGAANTYWLMVNSTRKFDEKPPKLKQRNKARQNCHNKKIWPDKLARCKKEIKQD